MTENKALQVSDKKAIGEAAGEPLREGPMFVPQVDILENGEALLVRADLPGTRKENVHINIEDGVLTLTATVEPIPDNWRPVYREYDVGGWTRRFTLGEQIDQSKISAKLDDGVLQLRLPKAEAAKPRKIEIQ